MDGVKGPERGPRSALCQVSGIFRLEVGDVIEQLASRIEHAPPPSIEPEQNVVAIGPVVRKVIRPIQTGFN